MTATMRKNLVELLERDEIVMAPGAYDALSAKIAVQAGHEAVYMTGFGVSGSMLGSPDVGLLTATEMADRARDIASASAPVPLIADADNGHGGPLNVARMTRLYEQSGVACMQLEDQVFPKRCGHMSSKEVVSISEAVAKISSAIEARESTDFLIMARTDARATHGFDEALRRGEAFLQAGADILFIEAPQSLQELEKVTQTFKGQKLVANMVEDGKTPYLPADILQEMGFSLVIYPVSALLTISHVLTSMYTSMAHQKRLPSDIERLKFAEYNSLVGLDSLVPSAVDEAK